MAYITFAEALIDALHISMMEDERISVIGSLILGLGPLRHLQDRIRNDFSDRIYDPPCSESAYVAVGIGASIAGDRPFIDVGTASFVYEAWSQIVNEAAVVHCMSGGQFNVPVVFHMLHGVRGGGAAQHSHSPQAMFWNCPGLEVVLPSSPKDVKGLIRSAIKSPNPTIVVDHAKLLGMKGEVPEDDYEIPFGEADVKRFGQDVTVVATSHTVNMALDAAEVLAPEGIDVEVVDPRTVVPLDRDTILASVAKTGRLIVVDEANISCSIASEIAAIVAECGFSSLKAPIKRVARIDTPIPFSPPLENYLAISVDKIVTAIRELVT